ncbi:MAG TPA: hypothetical protein PLG15_04285 [Candidatus Gastranaerophilaceae bacterium]|nr:hypothetical protein [Candidatus Gastranaerophilaceae bacterium]HPT41585.1 hypothetical protein [Candidatus Gastranaerophilaceae bacterium]
MAKQFSGTPQIKTRTALLIFIKGSSAPVVLYLENPQAAYEEIQKLIKAPTAALIEKEAVGPIKKVSLQVSQISAVALQEEQYV